MVEAEIILGPPGTGKTTALLGIVEEELARGVPPDQIAFLTFTRKGASEGATRAAAKFEMSAKDLRYFRTIHSLCFHLLGLNNGDVLEGDKLVEFGDWLGEEVSKYRSSDEGSTFGFTKCDRALFMENLARVRCVSLRKQYDAESDGLSWDYVERVQRALIQFKRDRHLVDFTDMLQQVLDQGAGVRLRSVIVDEFQDSSPLQVQVIRALAASAERFVVAGDDDQAIYRWAGADVEGFVTMPGRVRVLGQSWRVPRAGQALAVELIQRVRNRRPKQWAARPADGLVRRVQAFSQIDLAGEDTLVLGRNAYVLNALMAYLRREGVVFEWRGHSSVPAKTLQAVRCWESLRAGQSISAADARVVYEMMSSNTRVRRGYKTLPGLGDDEQVGLGDLKVRGGLLVDSIWHEAMDRIPRDDAQYILRARRRGEKLNSRPRVKVSTIHGAKGGEAEHVVLVRDMASRTYQEMRIQPEDEARVWFVGATRFKERMTILAPRTGMHYDV